MELPRLSIEALAALQIPTLDARELDLAVVRRENGIPAFDWVSRIEERALGPRAARPQPGTLPRLPRGRRLRTITLGPYSLAHGTRQFVLRQEGVPHTWEWSAEGFGGQPALTVTPDGDSLEITLTDAFYPGTTIPASFRATLFQRSGIWMLRLRLKFGGFDATFPLAPWLARQQWASSPVQLDDLECAPLGLASAMLATGNAQAVITADWVLATIGSETYRFDGFSGALTADAAVILPLPVGAQTLYLPPALRRTAIIFASTVRFALAPSFAQALPRVTGESFRFDGLLLEAGLLPDEKPLRYLLAQTGADAGLAGLETGGGLLSSDGAPFRIPIRRLRYAQLFDHLRTRAAAAFTAEVDQAPFWLHSPAVSLLLTQSTRATGIGLLQFGDAPPDVSCILRLTQSAPRMRGMLVRPETAPPRTEVVLSWGPVANEIPAIVGHVEIEPDGSSTVIRLPRDTSASAVRRDDFLNLTWLWSNLRLITEGAVRSLHRTGSGPAHLSVRFPPQSIGEETFFEADPSYDTSSSSMPLPYAPPIKALMAKPSTLVFALPDSAQTFPFDCKTLLDWNALTPSLAATALPGSVRVSFDDRPPIVLPAPRLPAATISATPDLGVRADPNRSANLPAGAQAQRAQTLSTRAVAPKTVLGNLRPIDRIKLTPALFLRPSAPTASTTRIELPIRLILSPNRYGAWVHAAEAVTHGERTELWHTRLAVRSGDAIIEAPHVHRTVRAIWSRDIEVPQAFDQPFLMPLDKDDRRQMVHLTSDFSIPNFTPPPIRVDMLMLSALGGWLDSDLQVEPPVGSDLSVENWRHRATQGRDHYVRVVYKGFLFPFGHRASLIKISERKVQLSPESKPVAYLRQRMYIVVREPERTFGGAGYAHGGRETPLRRIRITTLVTPNLNPPGESPLGGIPRDPPILAFWPRVGPEDFQFHLKAWDWEGREIDYLIPLAFVRSDILGNTKQIQAAVKAYNDDAIAVRRRTLLGGQTVALAEAGGYTGKTSFESDSLEFVALAPANNSLEPPCYPKLHRAGIAIMALRQMTGSNTPAFVEIAPRYLQHGFDTVRNRAGLFAQVPAAQATPQLDYAAGQSADRCGGVATPSMLIRGLSRELGTVGDVSDGLAEGHFKPAQFFGGLDARLLGGISLIDILEDLSPHDFLDRTPKLVTSQTPQEVNTVLNWSTQRVKTHGAFVKGNACRLSLETVLRTPKAGGSPSFRLTGRLDDFELVLANVVRVGFREFSFTSLDGRKPDVHVDITGISFTGDLSFVNTLRDYLEPGNFADPRFLDIGPQGITAGYNLTIPSVAVGVVSITNIALGARLNLPFTGEAMRLRFNLSERHSPFTVSVAPFGGGGFFALSVGMDGVETLEAALEFGGSVSIDLGVASGGVSVMAGIYLRIEITSNQSELTGYVRANGALQVLGLITVSLEFYLGLSYSNGKAWGECRVKVTVEVLLFSGSVTVTMRKKFAGSSGDPPFGIMMPEPRWVAYASAFA